MTKFFSLLKAVMSQDMQLFKYKAQKGSSNFSKALIPIILSALVMFSIGSIYLPIAMGLSEKNMTYVILEISIIFPSVLTLLEGVYKSQSIMFESKDTELLFSLPISKRMIVFTRVIKLYTFQLLYSLLFSIPGVAIYAYYEKPTPYFYAITTLMIILFPIIPTAFGCMFGYIIKHISSKFKAKKLVQLVFTFIIVSLLMFVSFSMQNVTESIIENAYSIDIAIRQIYYPISIYINLINSFSFIELLLLFAINILFIVLFVALFGKSYFNVSSKLRESIKSKTTNIRNLSYRKQGKLKSLLKKEFNKYFSSPVYMFNTLFGMVLLVIATIALCLNFDSAISYISSNEVGIDEIAMLHSLAPKVFLVIITSMSFMTSITSSSISIEGKSFNIAKSLPVDEKLILSAKILMSDIVTIPVILVCDLVFLLSFSVSIIDTFLILFTSIIAPTIAAVLGLIVNLKYPKMDASSETEIVKQSTSAMVAVFGGILLSCVFFAITFVLAGIGDIAMIGEAVLLLLILLLLWTYLMKTGKTRLRKIEC